MSRTITYRGPAPFASALAQMLGEEGAEVDFTPPDERRGTGVEIVVVVLAVKVSDKVLDRSLDAIIDAAVGKFRERFGRSGTEVEDDDP